MIFVGPNRAIVLFSEPASSPDAKEMERNMVNRSDVTVKGRINSLEMFEIEFWEQSDEAISGNILHNPPENVN